MKQQTEIRISFRFVKLRVLLFIAFCQNVVIQMTNNLNFPKPSPDLTDVTAAIDRLVLLAQTALDRSRQAIIDRNLAHSALLALMRPLAAYVQSQCQNNLSILNSSGFEAVKAPTPIGDLPTPKTPIVVHAKLSGMINCRTGKINGAYAYNWRVALASAPTVDVQTAQTAGSRHAFKGLTPGQTYLVQVNALGALGISNWSDASTLIVI